MRLGRAGFSEVLEAGVAEAQSQDAYLLIDLINHIRRAALGALRLIFIYCPLLFV